MCTADEPACAEGLIPIVRRICIALTPVLCQAALGSDGAAGPADLDAFWRRARAELPALPSGALDAAGPCRVAFPVTERASATAQWFPGTDPGATPVVQVVEHADAVAPTDGRRCHLYLPWRDLSRPLTEWFTRLDGSTTSPPVVSVLAACQAVDLVRSSAQVTAMRVGVVGDGFGAGIALAAAALRPERVAFVVLHQPRPAFYRLPDGTLTGCPAIRPIIRRLSGPELDALAYCEPLAFAAQVHCPAFVIAGGGDAEAPPGEIGLLYRALPCPKDARVIEGLGHCRSGDVEGFADMLERVDDYARRRAGVTSP